MVYLIMKASLEHKGKIGIYCIINTVNGKYYIGKAICIYSRIQAHISGLKRKSKDENIHLINAYHKYSKEAFTYLILEELKENNFEKLSRLEEKYILNTGALSNKGYNLRLDTEGGIIPSLETRSKLSIATKKRWEDSEKRKIYGQTISNFWKNNPEALTQMRKKLSIAKEKYIFLQYQNIGVWGKPKKGELLNTYSNIKEIIKLNPNYKWQNIYAVCNGYKPTYMKCIWVKKLKI